MVADFKTNESKPAKSKAGSATKKSKKLASDPNPRDDEAGGACKFPMSRVRRLVRGEDPTTRTTPDSIFLINKASVRFLCLLCFLLSEVCFVFFNCFRDV